MTPRQAPNPFLALYALLGLLFGPVGRHVTDDMPEDKTHPYFPDHIWPYPILGMAVLVTLGLVAVLGGAVLEPGPPADPRLAINPRPEWYFLSLFQFVKLGPALVTSIAVPLALVLGLVLWPLLDARLGPRLARRLGWASWPVPKRNPITGTLWMAGLAFVGLLTLWAAVWPGLCLPWFYSGPVCGG
jgi:quinol-cytochrome oxidoreductase complex cytochrome b subunit